MFSDFGDFVCANVGTNSHILKKHILKVKNWNKKLAPDAKFDTGLIPHVTISPYFVQVSALHFICSQHSRVSNNVISLMYGILF